MTFSVLPLTPNTFLLANDWLSAVTVSPPTRPPAVTTPTELVPPSYTFVSVAAFNASALGVIVPNALFTVTV